VVISVACKQNVRRRRVRHTNEGRNVGAFEMLQQDSVRTEAELLKRGH
jgi:hypothetical protein